MYRAEFTNSLGTAITGVAKLTVLYAPTVLTNPANKSVAAGAAVTFAATAGGNPTPTVQWQVSTNGGATFTNITGATATTYSTATTAVMSGNEYHAVFTNSQGSTVSTAATLTILTAPVVTTNPTSQIVASGTSATFNATAGGDPGPTVQWQVSANGGKGDL